MKKAVLLVLFFIFLTSLTFAQNAERPMQQFDETVSSLAREIHAKLVEKRAERVIVGQFTFQGDIPLFSAYWTNQLVSELTNMHGRNYAVHAGNVPDAGWMISGEIVQVADIFRIYSTLTRLSDRSIEASFSSSFQRAQLINEIASFSGTGGGTASGFRMHGSRTAGMLL